MSSHSRAVKSTPRRRASQGGFEDVDWPRVPDQFLTQDRDWLIEHGYGKSTPLFDPEPEVLPPLAPPRTPPNGVRSGVLAAESAQSHLSIRDPHGSHPIQDAPTWRAGLDRLECTIFGEFTPEYATLAAEFLEKRQRIAARVSKAEIHLTHGALWVVQPGGRSWGNRYFPIVLECQGCQVWLADGPDNSPRIGGFMIGSVMLMSLGHEEAYRWMLDQLQRLGVLVTEATVSRVDIAVDAMGLPVAEVMEKMEAGQCISQSRAGSIHLGADGTVNGRYIGAKGSEAPVMCAYGKPQELKEKWNQAKQELLMQLAWQGELPEHSVRFEWRVKGVWLRRKWKNLRTVEQVFESLPVICEYLTTRNVRFVEEFDRLNKHHSRAETLSWWQRIEEAFVVAFGGESPVLQRVEKKPPNQKRVIQGLRGMVTSLLAAQHGHYETPEEVMEGLRPFLFEEHAKLSDGIQLRRIKFRQNGDTIAVDLPPPSTRRRLFEGEEVPQ